MDQSCMERMYIPVIYAADYRNLEDLTKILDEGADINELNIIGQTPLFIAAANGKLDMVKELLRRGADSTVIDKDGSTFINYLNPEERVEINEYMVTIVNIKLALHY